MSAVRRSGIAWSDGAAGPVLRAVDEPADWRYLALCAEVGDDSLFFPVKGQSTRGAKAICAGCPVQEPCLEYALEAREPFGVFGGKSERERRRILRERDAQRREQAA